MAREPHPAGSPDASAAAAEYVLGLMEEAERQAFARRLRDDAALRDEVAFWEDHFAALADETAPVTPPPRVQQALERRLFTAPPAARPSLWSSLAFWRSLSAAALAAAIVLGGVAYTGLRTQPQEGATLIATLTGEADAVRLAVAYDPETGTLRVNRVAGTAAAGRAFELWLIAGADAPVSLGLLPQEVSGRIAVPDALRARLPDAVLAISDEPAGGSPTGQPTGAVLATGQVLTVS